MAVTTTITAWSVVDYALGYSSAGNIVFLPLLVEEQRIFMKGYNLTYNNDFFLSIKAS